jgi:hypothetical protein
MLASSSAGAHRLLGGRLALSIEVAAASGSCLKDVSEVK